MNRRRFMKLLGWLGVSAAAPKPEIGFFKLDAPEPTHVVKLAIDQPFILPHPARISAVLVYEDSDHKEDGLIAAWRAEDGAEIAAGDTVELNFSDGRLITLT